VAALASLATIARVLLGISAYQAPTGYGPELNDPAVVQVREALGGQVQPIPTTRLRWYLADLERAQYQADAGDLLSAAQLYRAMRIDATLAGLLGTRSGGLTALPKKFYGDGQVADDLRANNGSRSVFDEMIPPSELNRLDEDGFMLGVGVGELIPVAGRDYPVLERKDPENLQYRWVENRWYFRSTAGLLPITPGDGRWVLHTPGSRISPWIAALWYSTGQSWINKSHAKLYKSNWEAKLANPARVAISPQGGSEAQKQSWFRQVMAWGVNTVFGMTPGYDVKLLESNGKGWDCFVKTIEQSDKEYEVAIAGQNQTTQGGAGFSNQDVPEKIRADLIKSDADSLAYTVNTQILPAFIAGRYGLDAVTTRATTVQWDTTKPKALEAEARTFQSLATGLAQLQEVFSTLSPDREIDVDELAVRYAIPTRAKTANDNAAATVVRDDQRAA
jgi:Protein of unknown function (DUF935)